jgi:hypothetical protein
MLHRANTVLVASLSVVHHFIVSLAFYDDALLLLT